MTVFKRLTALFLCLVLIAGLCACREEEKSTSKNKTSQSDHTDDTDDTGDTDDSGTSGDNGGSSGSGSDFWENEEGLTVPPETAPDETAQEVADQFLSALQAGDWETVNQRLLSYALFGGGTGGIMQGGIMEKIMSTMTVKSQTLTDNGDSTYSVAITIEAIDYRALLEALPEDISSTEEAREEMLRLADTAARGTFEGEFAVLRYSEAGSYFIEPELSFLNAITGGYCDIYMEVMEGVTAQ